MLLKELTYQSCIRCELYVKEKDMEQVVYNGKLQDIPEKYLAYTVTDSKANGAKNLVELYITK